MARIKLENFYVKSSLFSVLSLAGAAFNYALYPVLARVFDARQFGDFTAIVALSNQIMGIQLAFNLTSIYLVKKYPEEEAREKAQVVQKFLIWLFVIATLIVLVFSPLIKRRLHIADPLSFILLAVLLLANVPAVIWTGYLQGHKRLIKVGVYNFINPLFKFMLAIILAMLGGVRGGLFGIVLGLMLSLITLHHFAGIKLPHLRSALTTFNKLQRDFMRGQLLFILGSVLVVGLLSILQNIDIVFAKALFSSTTAGVYSGISILSNALYYVAFLLVWILLPEISIDSPLDNRRLLKTAYSLLASITLMVVVLELALQKFLTRFVLGNTFGSQSSLLVPASLFQLSLVAVMLYAYYLLVLRKRQALTLAICVFVPVIVAPYLTHVHSPLQMINSLALSVLFGTTIYSIIAIIKGSLWQKNS